MPTCFFPAKASEVLIVVLSPAVAPILRTKVFPNNSSNAEPEEADADAMLFACFVLILKVGVTWFDFSIVVTSFLAVAYRKTILLRILPNWTPSAAEFQSGFSRKAARH